MKTRDDQGQFNRRKHVTPNPMSTMHSPSPSEVPEVPFRYQNHNKRLSSWQHDQRLQQSHAARSNLDI